MGRTSRNGSGSSESHTTRSPNRRSDVGSSSTTTCTVRMNKPHAGSGIESGDGRVVDPCQQYYGVAPRVSRMGPGSDRASGERWTIRRSVTAALLFVMALLFILLTACSDSSGPSGVGGNWSGLQTSLPGDVISWEMTITESGGEVSGNGKMDPLLADDIVFLVSGTRVGRTVSLVFTSGLRPPVRYEARSYDWGNRTQLRGTLSGGGFDDDSLTMTRH